MKIALKNIGALKQAEFTLGDLTIICGGNNTGKTYATYALYGFLHFWTNSFTIEVPDADVLSLLYGGRIDLDLEDYIHQAPAIFNEASEVFTPLLPNVFASSEKKFSDSCFSTEISPDDIRTNSTFVRTMGSAKTQLFTIAKEQNSKTVTISLLVDKENVTISQDVVKKIIGDALKDILFGQVVPPPFIASAERTGAAIFRKEHFFTRNEISEPFSDLPFPSDGAYALPVKFNLFFTDQLELISKRDSYIALNYPEILNDFTDIIGGEYHVTDTDELYFAPKGGRIKLTMDESSSSVRSLVEIGFYLRHSARRGDMLMVDEPELNLHPENQRRVARLLARLVNVGIKVFITTHSDYIIKELNTLIMLNRDDQRLKNLAAREGYGKTEFLDPGKVRVYIAEETLVKLDGAKRRTRCQTLVPADIDERYGIEARSFDTTIEEMNRIQEEIVWGGDE